MRSRYSPNRVGDPDELIEAAVVPFNARER